jgi:GT2 family glycosyltransferase
MLDLSIIVLNYNQPDLLRKCLKAVYDNTPNLKFEVILVDNASTDSSVSMTEKEFPEVIIIHSDIPLGFTGINNLGLKIAKGRYICLLNNDAFVYENCFNRLLTFLEGTPKAGIAGPTLLNPDGTLQHQGSIIGKKFWKSKVPIPVQFVIGACFMFKRAVFEKIGFLDENLFFYNDDIDYCLSAKKAGFLTYFVPDAKCVHIGGYSSRRVFNRRLFVAGWKGGLYFAKKHYGVLALWVYKLFLILSFIIALPFILFPKVSYTEKIRAYWEIVSYAIIYA